MGTLQASVIQPDEGEVIESGGPDADGPGVITAAAPTDDLSCGAFLEDVPVSAISLPMVMAALSDPIRLKIVSELADGCELTCNAFELPIAKSTKSHHFSVLAQAGIVTRRVEGKTRKLRLRREDLDQRFPGLIDAVLAGIDW